MVADPAAVPQQVSLSGSDILGVGDSVLLGAANHLQLSLPDMTIDAQVGRQVAEAIQVLKDRAATTGIASTVVIQIGNNGIFSAAQFDQIMAILGPQRRVVFINLKVPQPWQDVNNANIASGAGRYTNVTLVDWQGASAHRPELFASDGVHIGAAGGELLASLITSHLAR